MAHPRPYAHSLRRYPSPSGPFLSHSQVKDLAAFTRGVTYEDIDQACERVERVLMKGIPPRDLRIDRGLVSRGLA